VAWHPKTKRARLRQVPRVEQGGLCHGRHPARVAEVSCGAVSGRRAMPVNVWLSIISAVGAVSAVAAHLLIASGYYGRLTQKVEDHDDRLGTAEAQLRDHETSSARGRAFTAQKAVKLGLADRVGTLDDALAKHGATRPVGMRGGLFSAPFLADEDGRRKDPEDGENVDARMTTKCPRRTVTTRASALARPAKKARATPARVMRAHATRPHQPTRRRRRIDAGCSSLNSRTYS
jgi:hypothetical protein